MKPQFIFRSSSKAFAACRYVGSGIATHPKLLVLGLGLAFATSAHAQLTWNNAGPTDNWSTAVGNENWTGGVVWSNSQDAIFGATPETVTPTTVNIVDDITFGGSWTIANGAAASINLTTDGASDITVDPTFTTTIAEVLSGTNTVTKLGTGTLVLSAGNTFNNGLTISAGTVSSTVGGGFGTGTVTINSGGTADFNFGANANVGNVFTGSGTISVTGGFTPALTNANSLNNFTGTLNVNTTGGGKFTVNGATANIGSGAIVNIASGATFYLPVASTVSGVTFNIAGAGNTENLGALRLENGTTIGATSSIVAGGNIQLGHNGNSAASTINAVISETGGSRSVEKQGTGTMVFGANNTYTGATILTAGTLSVSTDSAGAYNLGGGGTNGIVFNGGTLRVTGTTMTNFGNHTPTFTATKLVALDIASAANNFTITQALNQTTGGLTKSGAGTLTLTGASTFTGAIIVAGGKLTLSNTVGANTANGNFKVGTVTNTGATLNITSGANITNRFNLFVGDAGAGTGGGAVYQSGGALALTQGAGIDNLRIGSNAGGYGYYSLSGGSLTSNEVGIGASLADTKGVMDITGGTFTTGVVAIGRGLATSSGVLNALGGTVASTRIQLNSAGTAGASSVLTVGGGSGAAAVGTTGSATLGLDLANGTVAGTVGVANLLANGTLTTGIVTATNANPTALLNFNGGTLKATATNAGANFLTNANIDAVTVYSNGGTIDNSSTNVTIGKGLSAATGNGVTSVAVTNGGSGYIGAPLVTITGGTGNTATGYAVMADDGTGNGTYKVSSIVITSPGTYTVDPTTVTLTGGGASTAATLGAITSAVNTSGGMTFRGTGTTTLTAANTYTGATVVSQGTLALGATASLASTSLNVANGATFSTAAQATYSLASLASGITMNLDATTGGFVNGGTGAYTLGNALTLNFSTNALVLNQAYNLFDYASQTGDFASVNLTGALSGALTRSGDVWTGTAGGNGFSFDETSGILTVVAVPEPTVALLGALGAFTLLRRRRVAA